MSKKQYFENLSTEAKRLKPIRLSMIPDAERLLKEYKDAIKNSKDVAEELTDYEMRLSRMIDEYEEMVQGASFVVRELDEFNDETEDMILQLEAALDDIGLNTGDVPVYENLSAVFLEGQNALMEIEGLVDALNKLKDN